MAATGTIALNANSLTVTGSGTKFTTEAQVGGALVTYIGNVPHTFVVGAINSDTSITFTANYQGSNVSGQSFTLIDRGAYTAITAELGARTAQAIRGLNYDKANWQQILTSPDNAIVNIPDGSQYTGPSWLSLSNNALMKSGNLAGVTDTNASRSNIGITTQNGSAKVIKIGDVVYQSWMAIGTAIGSFNANTIGGTTWYTHYFKFTLPLTLNSGINGATATLVGANFGNQTAEVPAFIRVRRDNDNGAVVSTTTLTVAITTPTTGWIPYIHLIVTGA